MEIAKYSDDFNRRYAQEPRKTIVWGAGQGLKNYWKDLAHIDVICDVNAKQIKEINGFSVDEVSVLSDINEKIYIIVSVKSKELFYEICNSIHEYELEDVVVFHLFDNVAWGNDYWETAVSYQSVTNSDKMRVNIVCADSSWIFKKFTDRMQQQLMELGVDVSVSSVARDDVDINHHIPYIAYKPYPNDTLMITHVDNMKKVYCLKKELETASMGICMSKDTMNKLVSYGIPRNKLCYVNPAQDGLISVHKYKIGITHRCRDGYDIRKRESALLECLEGVNPNYFHFIIMGDGWDNIVEELRRMEFEVDYYPEFIYEIYNELMPKLDYFLYMGFDEGNMGYLDALAAGVGTIVTPQGYHLDVDCPIDYPCSTIRHFKEAFLDLQKKKQVRVEAVSEWTWKNYVLKHMDIWNYILRRKSLKELYSKQLCYEDGICSVYVDDNRI